MNPLFDPDNWELVYSEGDDTHYWAYTGPEAQPWMLRGADPFTEKPAVEYNIPLPNYGDLMDRDDYLECVHSGSFMDYDGCGHPVKDGAMASMRTIPSKVSELPSDATHVMWFNR